MSTDKADDQVTSGEDQYPIDWMAKFKGHPASIVVPPYIRYLSGSISLRKAVIFFKIAEAVSLSGHPAMSKAIHDLNISKESKQIGIDFDTYFAALLTINLVSEIEHFLSNVVAAALRLYPEKMGAQTFKLSEIVAVSSIDELIDRAANSSLNSLMYEKPLEYVKKLADILSINAKSLETQWPPYVELKARRDLGVHNNWIVNEIYLRKLREAGIPTSLKVGSSAIPDFAYVEQAISSGRELVDKMVGLLGEKWIDRDAGDLSN